MMFDRGTFWALSFTYFYLPKSVETRYFCSGPISVDPIFVRNQGMYLLFTTSYYYLLLAIINNNLSTIRTD